MFAQPKFSHIPLGYAKHASEKGGALIEFALVAPILFLLVMGLIQFSWLMMSLNILTTATSIGAQLLSAERGYGTPYTDTVSQVLASAATLTPANLTVTTLVDGIACQSDAACAAALSSGQGKSATVSVSYKFIPILSDLFGVVLPATLNSSMVGRVQ